MLPTSSRHDKIESARIMLRELRQVAQAERCDMLAYLIEMAYVEASDILRGVRPATVLQQKPPTSMTSKH